MNRRKILIVGGAGFIGSNFVHYYADKYGDAEIVVMDKLTYAGNLANIEKLVESGRVKFYQVDIADLEQVYGVFEREKFDIVVNFAAETHVDRSIIEPDIFVQTNIVGTHNLLMCAKDTDVGRFHQVSTDEVYGDLGDDSDNYFTEATPIDPNCPYAAAKASADLLVRSYFETYGYGVTISRCSNNYGPFQFPEKVIPFFIRLAMQGKKLPVYGDGGNVRDWLYVEDHCEAIDVIIERGRIGEAYNIGGNNERRNIELAEMILEFFGKSKDLISYVDDRKAHDRRYAIDASKIKNELGWEPKVKFEDGIARTFAWYKENEDWVRDLEKRVLIEDGRTNRQAQSIRSIGERLAEKVKK